VLWSPIPESGTVTPDVPMLHPSMRGETGVDLGTAVVTGARGVGYEVGRGLARAGMRVISGVRNPELGDKAATAIRAEDEDSDVTCELVDLADLSSVAAFGERMRARHDRLDVLVNNAGVVMPPRRETTSDGFELRFGTNHLGHFALTSALLPLLKAADAPRVVVVGSLAHRVTAPLSCWGRIDSSLASNLRPTPLPRRARGPKVTESAAPWSGPGCRSGQTGPDQDCHGKGWALPRLGILRLKPYLYGWAWLSSAQLGGLRPCASVLNSRR
jgi:hypothetical protein